MFVACSTRCFAREPFEAALRHIVELEFNKVDLAFVESGLQLRPSEAADNAEATFQRIRRGPALTPSGLDLDFGAEADADPKLQARRFDAMCRLAKPLTVAVLTIPASKAGTPFDDEVRRLAALNAVAVRQGLVLTIETHSETLTADPSTAVALCKAVPGLGLTLDPSHYIHGPHQGANYDEVFPFVQDIHLRDTGKGPDEFQVRIGQGDIEYGRVVSQLERYGYNRALTVAVLDREDNPFDTEVEVRKLKLLLESLI